MQKRTNTVFHGVDEGAKMQKIYLTIEENLPNKGKEIDIQEQGI